MNVLFSALAPVFLIIIYIYLKDKYEKESKRILIYTFILGAVISIVISTILYNFFDLFLPTPNDFSVWQQFIKAFFIVALIEEFSKY
ncbi:MAG: PrsW family intramembrane metalloprotease, partial [Flavobacteriaceae bacterium]|nr:PrsW family intramembrane metalloprotease [Flavobacteriaceae bacterium]